MTLDTFFEKFDLFADAPDAVAKMRELVLNLAVQGHLVSQDAEDECVEFLLARNDEARYATAQTDRRADAENQPLLSSDDRWEIPESWAWRGLADLVLFVDYRGKTPAKLSSGIRLLTAKNVRKGEINLTPEEFLSEEEYQAWMTRGLPKAGDVLFTTEAPMGNAAVVKLTDRFALAQRVICFQSYGALDPSFLVLQILSTQFQLILDKNGTGVTAKGIKASKLKQLPIALPPLAEQKRIVAKVDELMAFCDRLEAQQQEREAKASQLARASLARFADAPTPANLDYLFHSSFSIPPSDLRKSILTLAVQGKLVPQDPNDEPTLTLLGQIAAHKAALAKEGRLRGSTTVKPMADDEAEFEIPSNWCWVRFGEIMVNRDGERIPVSKEERETKAKIYDYYGASGVIDKIDGFIFDKPLLLIGEDGANLINRSTPIAFIARGRYWVNNHAHVLDGISEDFLQFVELHINAINLEKYVTGSAQPKMNQAKMNSIPLAIPPLAEQRRIVAKVEQLMALVDALETQLAASRTTAANLLSALVAELTQAT